jgi:hypothetical protein
MRNSYILILLSLCFVSNSFGQSILNPNDSVITYNSSAPPTQPAFGQIGKWVRTKRLSWNTNEYKCYIYKGCAFRLHFPKTYNPTANDGKKYPVFVFFHGLGETGTIYDNEYQLYHGGDVFQAAVDNGTFDGYILCMQSQGFWGGSQYQYITEIINYMIANNKADPFWISDNGLSAGGQGTWEMLTNYPTYISAALPMSAVSIGYKDTSVVNTVKYTPMWLFQGGKDGSPAPSTAQQVRDAIQGAGGNFTYTEFSTLGHDTWDSAWQMPDFWPFMLRSYGANPWPLYGRTKFCPGDNINVTLGLAKGFAAYQWRYNGSVLPNATSNTIQATQPGTYDARVQRNGIWSDWSRTPVQIIIQSASVTPPIQVAGLMSQVIPAPDGNTSVNLQVSGNASYISYVWKKVGSDSVYSVQPIFKATQPGYYIVAANQQYSCSSLFSAPFKVIDAKGSNAPNAVKSLLVNALSNTQIQLAWSQAAQQANAPTAFEIYRGTTSGSYSYTGQVSSLATSYVDSGLAPKTKYFYVVRAVDSTGAAAISTEKNAVTFFDTIAPSIPLNLTSTYTTTSTISIAWTASTDNVAVDHYAIYLNGTLSNITKQTSFVLTGLVQNQPYAITVKAVDGSNNYSLSSNQITAEPILGGLQYKFYTTAAAWSVLPNFATLTPVKTGVSQNTDITVATQSTNYGFLWQGYLQVPVNGTYSFQTTSDDGSAFWFNSPTPTGTPTVNNDGLHGSQSKTSSALNLTAGIYPVCIEYFQAGGGANMSISWACTALFGNTTQQAIANTYFKGSYVNAGSVPAVPTNVTATATAFNKINLTWKDNSNNETGFEVYRSTSSSGTYNIVSTTVANATTFTDSTLSPSATYYYKVQAINKFGNSGLSQPPVPFATTFALPAPPATPSNFKATAISTSQISLTWNSVSGATGYQLLRSIGDSSTFRLLTNVGSTTTSYVDTGLNSNLTHYYRIKAAGVGGTFSVPAVAFATTKDNAPVITKLGATAVPYGVTTSIAVSATDSDGDALTFATWNLPSFASVTNTGVNSIALVLNPVQANTGVYNNVTITVSDPYGGKDSTVFTLTVNNNFPPTIDSIGNYTVSENGSLSIPLTAHDQNSSNVLTWSVSNVPNAYTLQNNSNGSATLILHPNYLAAGSYTASVTVNDGQGGSATRQFNLVVKDVNPNVNIYTRFQYVDTIGAPWNSITTFTTNNLKDASGTVTNVGLFVPGSWFTTYNTGPTTGNNSGVFPDAVLEDYLYFGIFGGPETMTMNITGLDTSRLYNLTFFAASVFPGAADNGSTVYTVGSQSVSLPVQANTKNTVSINSIKPASNGTITFGMSKGVNTPVGYINALIINSLYDDGTIPAVPTSLSAQNVSGKGVQLSWNDVAYNESGYNVYRALASNQVYALIGQTKAEATGFTDTSITGNTQYLYKIAAFNSHGVSAYSNIAAITTTDRIPQIAAISDVAINYTQTATVNVKATDDSTDHITLTATNLPPFATFTDNGNGTGTISITPGANNVGGYLVTMTATDIAKASTSTSFNILISDPNVSSTYLSFSDGAHSVPKPWNMLAGWPSVGATFTNITDDSNTPTGMTVRFRNGFSGVVQSGMQPVDGLGIYPNVVMRTAEFESSTNKDTIQISGLSGTKKYNFVFFNSHDDGLVGNTNFTINGTTVTLNATDNISKTVQINGISPDASGNVYIAIQKVTGSDYAFISTLIIQSYASTYTNLAPANLRTTTITRNSIGLQWQDKAYNETGYQVWRAADSVSSYTLLATLPVGTTSYTDANLATNKTYNYAVRAVFGTTYSAFSNTVSASTYSYSVYLNYTTSNDAPLPWNNTDAIPQIGYTWNNFFDEKGMTTSTGMQLTTNWAGLYSAGMNPLNNSGVVPDTVMIDSYGLFPGQTATFQITGLNVGMKYNFTFFASSQAYGDVNVAYTINGVTTLLNTSLNINGTQTIYGVTPDSYGNVTISVAAGTPASQFGLIGALIIGAYTPSVSTVIPALPAQSLQQTLGGTTNAIATAANAKIKAFPNPFHDNFTLVVPSQSSCSVEVLLYDISGKLVYKNEFENIQKGSNTLRIRTGSNLTAGVYTAVVINADTKTTRIYKLVKE